MSDQHSNKNDGGGQAPGDSEPHAESRPSGEPPVSPQGFLHEQSWTSRNGFPDWLPALVWVVLAFVLFQIFGNLFAVVYLMIALDDPSQVLDTAVFVEHLDGIFLGNSIFQILIIGMLTWLIAGLSTTGKRSAFLRFRHDEKTLPVVLQTVLLVIFMQPTVWLLGWINAQIPMPDAYMAMEEVQLEMITSFLTSDNMVLLALIHVGLVPSVCEEILFRGYAQRLMERSWGIWAAIIVGGLLFGLFHIRLTQLIPLAAIGMLLSWLVWRSDSIYPAMVGHFVNNGGSVIMAGLFSDIMTEQLVATELPPLWLVFASIGGIFMILRYIHQITKRE
ncbi:type II CAAX endopeptidase family protein [Balneolales bacterium ANBcel1]|nr:type II CAAX endopeptidase family protein [Balneolales bacterium ANBcel1]